MHISRVTTFVVAACLSAAAAPAAEPVLIAVGSISGVYEDFATRTAAPLENGIAGNLLGGMGSALAWAGGNLFIALPDRGPNAKSYNPLVDDTASYIPRFHTLHLTLAPSGDPNLPFVVTPMIVGTTLLSSRAPLFYGTGAGLGVGNGAPPLNAVDHVFYFSGRSDNFNPATLSTDPQDARLDPEGIRVSRNGRSVFVTDEYGPFVYEFDRQSGRRVRAFTLPDKFGVTVKSPVGSTEIGANTSGRVANKGMEGLAIAPDGRTLFGIMQSPLLQDGGANGLATRIVRIDVASGKVSEFAYRLDSNKFTVSEMVAVNDHEFLVDERDGKGLNDDSIAVQKKLYKIDLAGATDVTNIVGSANLIANAVPKTLFLDVVSALNLKGIAAFDVPAKLEGVTFGPDVVMGGATRHTLIVANDNDYTAVAVNSHHPGGTADNPNKWLVFAFDDNDLPGFVPQCFAGDDEGHGGEGGHDGPGRDRNRCDQ
ncbi:MAG TPA: esterase-like activity of phytase family protein [Vicinamibacterales bacterium]|nr:esterase-like activity of phytase family protein [Vicinamibacterales bacterium]